MYVLQTFHSENFRRLERPAKTVPSTIKRIVSSNDKQGTPKMARPPPGLSWSLGDNREEGADFPISCPADLVGTAK